MKILEKISGFVGKYMALIVLVIAGIALSVPPSFSWIKTSWINTLLCVVMFGMGLTLRPADFKVVFSQPQNVILGFIAQFSLMPGIAYLLVRVFELPLELAVGVILVGCAPGGTSSNVMTYLAKGDIALSICMTAVSTLLAPIMTPSLTWLLIDKKIEVSYINMFLSIIQVVILPIGLGVLCTQFFSKITAQLAKILPLISVTAIVMIIASVVAANASKLITNGLVIVLVVICHNTLGYATGYGLGRVMGLPRAKRDTLSIEVGMQNSGLATTLAITYFAAMPMAAIPGAIFSVWHNISGSILANFMALRAAKETPDKVNPTLSGGSKTEA